MGMKIFLLLVLIQVGSIRSDSTSIISEFNATRSAHYGGVDTAIDGFINEILARGKVFADGNDFLKTKIIDRLRKLNGRNIYNARELNKIYQQTEKLIKTFLSFTVMKNAFNSDFKGIEGYLLDQLNTYVVAFTTSSSDTALIDSCWSTNKNKVTTFLDGLKTDFSTIINNASPETSLVSIEAGRTTYFLKHESTFKSCNYKWECIDKYV
jgi:hypothetical protein